ncbi:MAG: M16 family metallopeptidase [Candidatus Loosdrechtia sp.]|uniref:M16 family metallopeptidase n=1 Tax=Candidatus Loosdrechtia sp. TaxID=3101272 RepID=UPI003A700B3D|nr:MAG: pitrilysin family protein [Candidatus Jettenia sp. AMX2]
MRKKVWTLAFSIIMVVAPFAIYETHADSLRLDVKEHVFENGLKLLMLEKHDVPIACLRINYKAGSVDERPGITGVSHLFEHMMFKGTKIFGTRDYHAEKPLLDKEDELVALIAKERNKDVPDNERLESLRKELEEVREKLRELVVKDEIFALYLRHGGAGLNAATGIDGTYYFCDLPANKLELWAFIESDRMKNLVLREFYSERDVVLEERRLRTENSPFGLLMKHLRAVAFIAHPYRWPTIGWRSDIENITKEETDEYFRKYYAPNNTVIVMVGSFNPDDAIQLVERYFGDIPAQSSPPKVKTVEPEQRGERRVAIEFDSNPYLAISYHVPAIGHPDIYALHVLGSLLSDGRTSRLYRSLIEDRRIAVMAHAFCRISKYPDSFVFVATPRAPHTAEEVELAFYEEIEKLKVNPPSDWELQKIKNQLEAEFIRGLNSASGLANEIGHFEVLSDWRYINTFMDKLARVTAEDIVRVTEKYLTKRNRTVATIVKKEEKKTGEIP